MDRTERYNQKEQAVTEMEDKLKEIGMYEEGMPVQEMTALLSAVNASVDSTDKDNDFKNILEESVLKSQELDQVRENLHETINKVEKQISPPKSEESNNSQLDVSLCQPKKANKFFKSANYVPDTVHVLNWVDCNNKGKVNKTKKNRKKKSGTLKKTKSMDKKEQSDEENTKYLMKSNESVKCETGKASRNVNTKQKHLNETHSISNNITENVLPEKSVKMAERSSESSSTRIDEKKHCVTGLEKKRHETFFTDMHDLKCQFDEQPFFLVTDSKAKLLSIDVQARLVNLFLSRQVQSIASYQKSLKPSGTRIGKPIVTSENFNECLERNPFKPPQEKSNIQIDTGSKQSDSDDDFVTKQIPKEEKPFQRNVRKGVRTNDEILATSKLFADVSSPSSEISLIIRGDDRKKEKEVSLIDMMNRSHDESSFSKGKVFKKRSDAIFEALKNNEPTENIINIVTDKSDSDSDLDHAPIRRSIVSPIPNKSKSTSAGRVNKTHKKQPKISMQNDVASVDMSADEEELKQCPICNRMFSISTIEGHASICSVKDYDPVDVAISGLRPLKRRRTPSQQETKRNKLDK